MKKIMLAALALAFAMPVIARELTGFGINAGVGTDITLGIAAGAGASYVMFNEDSVPLEIGFNLFYSSSSSTWQEGSMNYTYNKKVTSFIYAVVINALFNYDPKKAGIYQLVGAGAGGVSLSWVNHSDQDPTYNDSGDGTGGSAIVNLGVGGTFGNGFELRAQLPIFITFTGLGTIFSPALTLGAGLRM